MSMSAQQTQAFEQYELWLSKLQDDTIYGEELRSLAGNTAEIFDRFYTSLAFGTAGLRGVLGAGTNRMNLTIVGQTTQGLATYLNETSPNSAVAIAYDSRNFSKEFAHYAAEVFAGNGIRVHIFSELMPTPTLSYAIRELGCASGINITASHNPAIYNGYKAYGSDGCQLSTEASGRVTEIIKNVDLFEGVNSLPFATGVAEGNISFLPDSFVEQYIERVFKEALQPQVCPQANLKVVYTPLNGAGLRCVLSVLEKSGVSNITLVPEQTHPDGNFPTAPYPNPETKEALALGLALAQRESADILVATDPDCDRLGVAVKHRGSFRILTGNEVGVLLLDYIIKTRRTLGKMPSTPFTIRSIVTTKLTDAVAITAGVEVIPTLTGFKNIGSVILEHEKRGREADMIFAFEESCGYLSGTYVRDKDAVNAAQLTVEMASAYYLEGKTLVDVLDSLEQQHGAYEEYTQNFAFQGAQGMETMREIMANLRRKPPAFIGDEVIAVTLDYASSQKTDNSTGESSKIPMLSSDVLEYEFEDGSSVIIRPSGTEPKIKVYYLLHCSTKAQVSERQDKTIRAFTALVGQLSGQTLEPYS